MVITIGQRLGSYEITALLGKGGMGEVYRARDAKLKRDVAIKILPDEFSRDADRVSRFQREAEALAALNHPNIGGIYDLQHSGTTRFLVLELVEGDALADILKRSSVLPLDKALLIAKQICDALEAAHEKGIVHRDLKPANIKVTLDGNVKLLDFGLAKVREGYGAATNFSSSTTVNAASASGVILGTAAYMSPEQVQGKKTDRTSDVWAFGCVLYEMLSGFAVFEGETVGEILGGVLKSEPDWNRLPAETPEGLRPFAAPLPPEGTKVTPSRHSRCADRTRRGEQRATNGRPLSAKPSATKRTARMVCLGARHVDCWRGEYLGSATCAVCAVSTRNACRDHHTAHSGSAGTGDFRPTVERLSSWPRPRAAHSSGCVR
jgi:serine/threonine protein kinase